MSDTSGKTGVRYGQIDRAYGARLATTPPEDDGPVWMVNLMKYRDQADYAEGDGPAISGREADDRYSPLGPLAAVGAEVVLVADVERQLLGDSPTWDRIAVVKYATRRSFIEMQSRPDFVAKHKHKDAGMEQTIIMGTQPLPSPQPRAEVPEWSDVAHPPTPGDGPVIVMHVLRFHEGAVDTDMVSYQKAAGEVAVPHGVRIAGWFGVEGTIVGDRRAWDQVRYNEFPSVAAFMAVASDPGRLAAQADHREVAIADTYTMILRPSINRIAEFDRLVAGTSRRLRQVVCRPSREPPTVLPCSVHLSADERSRTMATIPSTIDEITPTWLRDVAGLPCETAEVTQIGVGIGVSSALYRVALTGEGCPTAVIIKLPALDEAAVFTSTMLRMYIREVRFFEELADQVPIRVPSFHYGEVDEETSGFVVVMEDLCALRIVDQLEGMEVDDADRAVDAMARWHAQWWGKAEDLATDGMTVHLRDPIYPAVLPLVFGEGWAKLTAEHDIPAEILPIGPRFSDALPGLLDDLGAAPTTMCHGDYRADNILFGDDGEPVLLDFQLIGTGAGAYDLAYFITQSLRSEDAEQHEQRLFTRWCDGLEAAGVSGVDRDAEWLRYRKAALFCLVYPVVASRGMDLSDPRQRELIEVMDTRFARAATQLELAELL